MNKVLIGSHIGLSAPNYFLDTCKIAVSLGETAFMFYSGAPQNSLRISVEKLKIKEGQDFLEKNDIKLDNIIVHAPYIINLANTIDKTKFEFSVNMLKTEIFRTNAFGCKILVLHPGSTLGADVKSSLDKIVEGLDSIFKDDNTEVIIAIETMSGKGNEVGKTFDEISYIINNSKYPNRIGVCLDTCHINDAGYCVDDIEGVLSSFDQIIGLDKLKVIHLNDSKNSISSHKDRHENIGFGTIGFDTLDKYVFNSKLKNIPKILETPYIGDTPPYKYEISMLLAKKFDPEFRNKIIRK